MRRFRLVILLLVSLIVALSLCLLIFGSVDIPARDVFKVLCSQHVDNEPWRFIVIESRLPLIATAALSGAALAVSGLLLQTLFSNALADPSILGISTGASLGAGCVMLSAGSALTAVFGATAGGYIATLSGAFIGALAVMMILLFFSNVVKSASMLLIVGVLIGYIASSAISLLNFFATEEGVHSFMIWGLGNFSGVMLPQLPLYAAIVTVGLLAALLLIKPLNAMLLGSRNAENLGVNLRRMRNILLALTGMLTAVVTAFCGPIGFIGLVVPHIARLLLRTSDHYRLIPTTILAGAATALLCALISVSPLTASLIPINAITPIVGVPVIIYVIVNRKRIFYFN